MQYKYYMSLVIVWMCVTASMFFHLLSLCFDCTTLLLSSVNYAPLWSVSFGMSSSVKIKWARVLVVFAKKVEFIKRHKIIEGHILHDALALHWWLLCMFYVWLMWNSIFMLFFIFYWQLCYMFVSLVIVHFSL